MTREDIIHMAREAGFKASVGKTDKDGKYHPDVNAISRDVPVEWLERFAALIASRVAAEEREACAKVLDHMADEMVREMEPSTAVAWVQSKAASIRARGQA